MKQAGEAAEEGSRGRNWRRETTRKRLTPGGRVISEALDQPRAWDDIIKKYGNPYESFEAAEKIADATGRTRASLRWLGTLGRWAGGLGVVAGIFLGGRAVVNAPPEKRMAVLVEEVTAAAGGGGGAVLGGWLGAGAVTLLASNPGGWVIAGAIAGGVVVGYAGERLGRWAGKKVVNKVEQAVQGTNKLIEFQIDRYWERQRAARPGCPPEVCGAPGPNEDSFYREGEHLNRDMRMRRSPF